MDVNLLSDERLDEINENLKIIQKKQGLTFGTDTYLLSAFIKENKYARAADLGSGTGIASLLCASKNKFAKIYAIEIQESFVSLIDRNAKLNNLENIIVPVKADVREVDASFTFGELDVVFSNPPYMKIDSGKRNHSDEKYIARHEVFGGIEEFCFAASRLLKFGGKFYCVYRPDRLSELMAALNKYKLQVKRMTFVHSDANSSPCCVLTEAKKGAMPSMKITKPLFIYDEKSETDTKRKMTASANSIYDSCSFENFDKSN